jgi:benzoyl-CoA reductase subunit D
MMHTVGIDVGCGAIKVVLMRFDDKGGTEEILHCLQAKIRRRNIKEVITHTFSALLEHCDVREDEIAYVASTGEGELVDFRRGHFYSMTTHARGALFLNPHARAVLDVGALHARALVMDKRSKVLDHRMTSQCASGSGQFLENISRYLGVSLEDVGRLSAQAEEPEPVSGICAVLAETDVINMVSRNIPAASILKGIHISIGKRLMGLLRMVKAEGLVLVTGGLAADVGLIAVLRDLSVKMDLNIDLQSHEHSVFAGAIGAALWASFRHLKLEEKSRAAA